MNAVAVKVTTIHLGDLIGALVQHENTVGDVQPLDGQTFVFHGIR